MIDQDPETSAAMFASVWDAVEDTPTAAANLKLRGELLAAIQERVAAWKTPAAEAARRLGLTRPRFDELLRGEIDRFGLDVLVDLLAAAGLALRIERQAAGALLKPTQRTTDRAACPPPRPPAPARGSAP